MRKAVFGRLSNRAQVWAPARVFSTIANQGLRLGSLVLMLSLGGLAAQAQTLASLPMAQPIEKNGTAKPVLGWVKFCERHPEECRVDLAEPAFVTVNPQIWRTIVSVNRRVNARIKPLTDKEHWGVVDSWDFPDDGLGDCEDYQLLKRKLLAERGFSRRAMRMTVVIDDLGEGHAVLMIRTDRGDYILDNKTSAVLPWRDTGYTYVKREGQDSTAWVSLGGVGSPVATANR